MKKIWIVFLFFVLVSGAFVGAMPETSVYYFYSTNCGHCVNIVESGILERVGEREGVSLEKLEVSSPFVREQYFGFLEKFGINPDDVGIPFLVIEQGGRFSYLAGDAPIIDGLEDGVVNFEPDDNGNGFFDLTLGVVVVSALIDSINPCAFGVLLFLMAVLLSMGSAKRALRAGLIYSTVVFIVYFVFGYFLSSVIAPYYSVARLVIGWVLVVGAVIEIKDFFFEGVGVSLVIPSRAKPFIEGLVRKGTLLAIILLGIFVAVVELPCTGGIYLAILSMIDVGNLVGILYLVLYNFIFVLPLILITYFVYAGEKVEGINKLVQGNKKFMRLAAGVVMLLLALYLLGVL